MNWTKLGSRKFWFTFGAGIIILFLDQLGLSGITPDRVWELVTLVTGYNIAQGFVDAKKPT